MNLRVDEHYRGVMIRAGYPDAAVWRLVCLAPRCRYQTAERSVYHCVGDRSGMASYSRMRAAMVRHWYQEHRRSKERREPLGG